MRDKLLEMILSVSDQEKTKAKTIKRKSEDLVNDQEKGSINRITWTKKNQLITKSNCWGDTLEKQIVVGSPNQGCLLKDDEPFDTNFVNLWWNL